MKALLEAAIAWRNADDRQQAIYDTMTARGCHYRKRGQLKKEHRWVLANVVMPAKRALHLAIEQAVSGGHAGACRLCGGIDNA